MSPEFFDMVSIESYDHCIIESHFRRDTDGKLQLAYETVTPIVPQVVYASVMHDPNNWD